MQTGLENLPISSFLPFPAVCVACDKFVVKKAVVWVTSLDCWEEEANYRSAGLTGPVWVCITWVTRLSHGKLHPLWTFITPSSVCKIKIVCLNNLLCTVSNTWNTPTEVLFLKETNYLVQKVYETTRYPAWFENGPKIQWMLEHLTMCKEFTFD